MCNQSRTEQKALWSRIQAAGCPIERDVASKVVPREFKIIQTGEAHLVEMGYSLTGVILCVRFARAGPGLTRIVEFGDLVLPEFPIYPDWLEPLPDSSVSSVYKLRNGFSFERRSVLNHALESGIRVQRGRPAEGFVLGEAQVAIPEKYKHGEIVICNFSVLDDAGQQYHEEVRCMIDRTCPIIQRSVAPKGKRLFEPCNQILEPEENRIRAGADLGDRVASNIFATSVRAAPSGSAFGHRERSRR